LLNFAYCATRVRSTLREKAQDEMSLVDQATRNVRRPQQAEKREIAFFVRAKTGPGTRDWSPVGVAFARKDSQPGFTIKLNTLPITGWNGALVLVPPFVDDGEPIED
jgi:hypothetical protein